MAIDTSGWKKKRKIVEKQVPFALALALTRTAKDAQKEVHQAMPKVFDQPNPFTRRSVAIIPAKKQRPVAWVLVKDLQARYLAIQEVGGQRRPMPGAPITIPVNIRRNRYGNIPRGAIGREVAKPNVFTVGPRDRRARKLPPGIYRRQRGRNRSKPPKMLVALQKRARYRPRFGFKRRVIKIVLDRFPDNFNSALRKALKTAR